ncbi:esterase [Pigmentiphaga litoralis]|uniref:alpha/beta hydrolase n=1 Tax=Pigmentiphaga litoralis TaxID=516702 RepID=UPI0019CC36EA|nr:alpha/beta hydrolase [Pigmentiphaga litoralis]GGX34191.1 esterase [Pigmentiphaga litoralis]
MMATSRRTPSTDADPTPGTPEYFEAHYNTRLRVPEFHAIQAHWAEASVEARHRQPRMRTLAYGDQPGETLDFFPAESADAPLFVFMHGGYWRALNKSDFSWVAPELVRQGVSVAVVDYALAPAHPIEGIVRQMLAAHAWMYRHADSLRIDRERIVTSGHSAGGHLTAMMIAARWPQWGNDLPQTLIHGGLAISGLFDLDPLSKAPFLAALGLTPQRVDMLSPAFMSPGSDARLITAVGGDESGEFKRQTALIAERWPDNVVRDVALPGLNHMTVCDGFAEPDSALMQAALELLQD